MLIRDGSTVVGDSEATDGLRAFRRTQESGMERLGEFLGVGFTHSASAVSVDGSVAVGSGTGPGGNEAFVWDEHHGMRKLKAVLNETG